jgi:hypothetical protein
MAEALLEHAHSSCHNIMFQPHDLSSLEQGVQELVIPNNMYIKKILGTILATTNYALLPLYALFADFMHTLKSSAESSTSLDP